MFSFVIYDRERGELFGAVDRFGKSLYIISIRGFELASQISQFSKQTWGDFEWGSHGLL